jgi:hypothetical protein
MSTNAMLFALCSHFRGILVPHPEVPIHYYPPAPTGILTPEAVRDERPFEDVHAPIYGGTVNPSTGEILFGEELWQELKMKVEEAEAM